jgi:hypothetical protein
MLLQPDCVETHYLVKFWHLACVKTCVNILVSQILTFVCVVKCSTNNFSRYRDIFVRYFHKLTALKVDLLIC